MQSMNPDQMNLFKWRLAETIAWCAPRMATGTPSSTLRTPALRPSMRPENVFETDDYDADIWNGYVHAQGPERTATDVAQLVMERARLLRSEQAYPATMAHDLAGGRLLLSAPDYGFFDGASEHASQGFIDAGDAPPWDTWVWFVRDSVPTPSFYEAYIVSWVPPEFVEHVDAGICVSFVDTIAWASDVDSQFSHQLRIAGLA